MLFVQPDSMFFDLICEELEGEKHQWQSFEFAVAWVNENGVRRIEESARVFLAAGGCIRATVGLDFSSTSYEGLRNLLDLEDGDGDVTSHVFHDENPACTFHPKIFLFSNDAGARLFVGSNNMTGAGLATNVEAASRVTGALNDETIVAARKALEEWRDTSREPRRTRRLTRDLLERLHEQGYVQKEADIRDRRRAEASSKSSGTEPLFGRSRARAATRGQAKGTGGGRGGNTVSSTSGDVLLMRVRPRRNGKQLQISMAVHQAPFMNSVEEVVSAADGMRRPIGYDHVTRKGKKVPNTARFEAPEMEGMENPVARFRWVDPGDSETESDRVLQYEMFDADRGGEGAEIYRRLEEGISAPPVTNLDRLSREKTVLSKSVRERAQWYRLDTD